MDKLLYVLPVFACPIAMGTMMWVMMRGNHNNEPQPDTSTQEELAMLRAEIAVLRAGHGAQPTPPAAADPTRVTVP